MVAYIPKNKRNIVVNEYKIFEGNSKKNIKAPLVETRIIINKNNDCKKFFFFNIIC